MNTTIHCSLLIDDDKATNFYNKYTLLKHEAFNEVNVVKSGLEGIEYLQKTTKKVYPKPNLIFLDINMPFMNGWEFLDKFKCMDKNIIADIKVIMLSTSDDPMDLRRAVKNEFVFDFINKPLSFITIDKLVSSYFSYTIAKYL